MSRGTNSTTQSKLQYNTTSHNTKTVTSMEMENRRVKWLCYWRPEFAIRHQCNGRQLLLIEVEDEDNEEAKVETEPEKEVIVKDRHKFTSMPLVEYFIVLP